MILLTVLIVLALAATLVVGMAGRSQQTTQQLRLAGDMSRLQAIIFAGESSVMAALRQDLVTTPEADSLSEAWAQSSRQDAMQFDGGMIRLQITDAQAVFNMNALAIPTPQTASILSRLVALAGLKAEVAARINAAFASGKALTSLDDLSERAGLSSDEIAALRPLVTVLPRPVPVNLNSAPDRVLAAFIADDDLRARIIDLRERRGQLLDDDFLGLGIMVPEGMALQSDYFGLSIDARFGSAHQSLQVLIEARAAPKGDLVVRAVGRWLIPSLRPI